VIRYKWIAARWAEGFPITMACKVAAGPTDAEIADTVLVAEIREIQADFDDTYGQPRMTPEFRDCGFEANHNRAERLMRVHGIVGVPKPANVRTTIPAEDNPPMPDLIGRRFAPGKPDAVWVGDITYIATAGEGWLYLTSVLDLGSRRWLGYSMADHMRTELVADALDEQLRSLQRTGVSTTD